MQIHTSHSNLQLLKTSFIISSWQHFMFGSFLQMLSEFTVITIRKCQYLSEDLIANSHKHCFFPKQRWMHDFKIFHRSDHLMLNLFSSDVIESYCSGVSSLFFFLLLIFLNQILSPHKFNSRTATTVITQC